MAAKVMPADWITSIIHERITEEVDRIIEDEIGRLNIKVRARIRQEVGSIALSVMNYYEVERAGDRIIISVKQDLDPNKPSG